MEIPSFFKRNSLVKPFAIIGLSALSSLSMASVEFDLSDDFFVTGARGVVVEGYNTTFDVTFSSDSFENVFAGGDIFANGDSGLDARSGEEADRFSRALFSQVLVGNLRGNANLIKGCSGGTPICDIATPYHVEEFVPGFTSPYTHNVDYSAARNEQSYPFQTATGGQITPPIMGVDIIRDADIVSGEILQGFKQRLWADWTPSDKNAHTVPEIDAASLPLSIGLLVGLVAFLRERRAKLMS